MSFGIPTNPLNVDSLTDATKGEVLLRIGSLAGWLGSASQTNGTPGESQGLHHAKLRDL